MAIRIGRRDFDGPFRSADSLEDRSGVYVILDATASTYLVLDCGESATVMSRVQTHERADCWRRNARGSIMYAAVYTPRLQAVGRREIEQAIRRQYSPPCGDR